MPVTGVVSLTDATASFTPSSPLLANTTYSGSLKTTIKDLKGNSLQVDFDWTFSTGSPPSVTTTDPANNATAVLLNKTVTATFNKPVDPLTVTATTFTLMQGVTPIAGVVSYSGSTATFTPATTFTPNTTYTGTLTTSVKDLTGNPMQADYDRSTASSAFNQPDQQCQRCGP